MSNTPLNADDRTYDCRECGKLVVANEYHPYLYCQLQKAGLLNEVLADRKKHELQARIDTATDILYGFSRTYKQEVTDRAGNVYVNDLHSYISKYEVQELIAKLKEELEKL